MASRAAPKVAAAATGGQTEAKKLTEDQWQCEVCTLINGNNRARRGKAVTCEGCGAARPASPIIVEHTKGAPIIWTACQHPMKDNVSCGRLVYNTAKCREHTSSSTGKSLIEGQWSCFRCSGYSKQAQKGSHCVSCKLPREAVEVRYHDDYYMNYVPWQPGSYCGSPAMLAEMLCTASSTPVYTPSIERHEIIRAVFEFTPLEQALIGPIIDIVVSYYSHPGQFKVGESIDVAIPEIQFSRRISKNFRWKAGQVSGIRGTQVCLCVTKDDYFDTTSGWYWYEWIDIFNSWDRLAPLATHRGDPWYATYHYPCWQGDVQVMCADGSRIAMDQVRVGDMLASPDIPEQGDQSSPCMPMNRTAQRVERVLQSRVDRKLPMVNMDGMWITRGHPVYAHNPRFPASSSSSTSGNNEASAAVTYDWWRPDECKAPQLHQIDMVYNLILENGHTVICSAPNTGAAAARTFICCTVGRNCGDRLKKARPDQAAAYGSGVRSGTTGEVMFDATKPMIPFEPSATELPVQAEE